MMQILISFFGILVYFLEITIFFQKYQIYNRAKFMFYLWLFNIPFLLIISFYLNTYLKINFIEYYILILFFYISGFFGGVLQLYNLADRGFSLRVLIDILESEKKAMTLDEIVTGYSSGKGLIWMYEKRLIDMKEKNLVDIQNNQIKNLSRGDFLAMIFLKLRQIININ